jgi:5'-3' exonuclease
MAMHAVRALGMSLWPMTRYQADDALASGAAQLEAHSEVDQVVICTTDRDLLQCVRGERVVLWDRNRDQFTDEAALRAKYGVSPRQIPDLFALVGDPSDGLPGVPGWGWKSAATVLAAHPTVDQIPEDPAHWDAAPRGAARLADWLNRRRVEAVLGRDLSVLRKDLPVDARPAAIRWNGIDRDGLSDLLTKLDDPDLAEWVFEKLG